MPFRPISAESGDFISESRIDQAIARDTELSAAIEAIFPTFEAETINYRQRVEQAGNFIFIPDLQRIDLFIKLLKAQNIWALIDEIGLFRFVSWPNQKIKFPNNSGASLTFNNLDERNYNPLLGIKGNGTNGSIGGGCRPPSTNGQNLHICYVGDSPTGRPIGWYKPNIYTSHYLLNDGNGSWMWGSPHAVTNSAAGVRIGTRPTSGVAKLFLNGFAIATHPSPDNSSVPDVEIGILAARSNETSELNGFSQSTISYYSVGKGLTDSQAAIYSKAISVLLAV